MINEFFPDFKKFPNKGNSNFNYQSLNKNVEKPLVTIVTPLYQTGEIFLETVSSVLNQSFQYFEWIIVNDCSTNTDTTEILAKVKKLDSRIKIIDHEQNKGPSASRNTGIKFAQGKYVCFVDSDDLIEQTLVEKFYLFLANNPLYDFVNSWSLGFNTHEYFWKKDVFDSKKFLEENLITVVCMGKKELFSSVPYNEEIRDGFEDWDFWLNILSKGKRGFTIPEFLFWYRRTDHAKKWSNWGDEEKKRKIIKSFQTKYAKEIQNLPYYSSDLNSSYLLNHIPDSPIPSINILAKSKKRILFIVPWIELGGSDKCNIDMISGLSNEWDFTVLTTLKSVNPWEPVLSETTPDIFHFPNLGPTNTYHLLVDYFIETRKPDILFLSNSMHLYWLLPYIKYKHPTLPIIDYIHCEDPGWMNGGYPRMNALMQPFIDKTVVTSLHVKKWILNARQNNSNNIEVSYTNIDTDEVKKNYAEREKLRKEWGVSEDFPIILFAARITGQKQPFVMVDTIKRLYKKSQNFVIIVLGDGPDFIEMKRLIKESGLENKVWCMGAVNNDEVKRYMDAADIFFLPSLYEGIALSIYEAMAKELVVVGAVVGGQIELVTPECGYLITPSTPQTEAVEYAEILFTLITNKAIRNEMKKNGRNRVESHFRLDDMLKQMNTIFSKLITKPTEQEKDNKNLNNAQAKSYLLLLYKSLNEENTSNILWNELMHQRKSTDNTNTIASAMSFDTDKVNKELFWYKNENDKIRSWYLNEYELLPLWYKRFGHILKVFYKRKSFKSLLNKNKTS